MDYNPNWGGVNGIQVYGHTFLDSPNVEEQYDGIVINRKISIQFFLLLKCKFGKVYHMPHIHLYMG